MQNLVSLDGYEPHLREYLTAHQWPDLMEALVSGLVVMLPEDPWEFVEDKITLFRQQHYALDGLQWDSFIDPSCRPAAPIFKRYAFSSDEADLPTEEMLEKAFKFRRNVLFRMVMDAWLLHHDMVLKEHEKHQMQMNIAATHYSDNLKRKITIKWKVYSAMKKQRFVKGVSRLRKMIHQYKIELFFRSWLAAARESKKAALFFRHREHGEDGGEEAEWFYPEGQDPISLLPRKVSIKIFSDVGICGLCRSAQVCRTWKDITEDPQLWNKVDLTSIGHYLTDKDALQLLQKCRPLLGHINMRGCLLLSAESFKYIGQCQNLQDLNLSECQGLTDEALKSIATGCSGMFYLNLSYCYVTDFMIRILTRYCHSLNYLSLAHCTQFTIKGIQSITAGKGCRKLVHLDLSGCVQLIPDAMHYIGKGCLILQTLLLNDIPNLADETLVSLVVHCHTLRYISFLGGSSLSDRAFKHLALENRKLKQIRIENNDVMSDVALRALSRACKDLQVVYLAGCSRVTDQGLKALSHVKKMRVLNIADCSRVSDAGIRYIVEGPAGLALHELNLTNCAKISDVTPLRISQNCKNLSHLSLGYCEHISDSGVELLSQLRSLVDLDVTGCSNLTDQGIGSLQNNPRIRHLGMAELVEITDDGIQVMSLSLTNLETIDLSSCESITDGGVQALVFNCQLLRRILLAGCPLIGDTSAKYISQGCSSIAHISLSATKITDHALRHFKKVSYTLKQLDILSCVHVTKEAVVKLQRKGVTINYNTDQPHYANHISTLSDLPVEPLLDRL